MPKSKVANPIFAKAVAEAYISGITYREIAEMFGVSRETIGTWVRDPRVQAHAGHLAQERVMRITRKIDKEIEGRLQDTEDMETDLLLKIRKEFLERALKVSPEGNSATNADTINEAVSALEDNPELAKQLKQLVQGRRGDES